MSKVTKTDIVFEICRNYGFEVRVTKVIVNEFFDALTEHIASGDEVVIKSLGRFYSTKRRVHSNIANFKDKEVYVTTPRWKSAINIRKTLKDED